MARRVLEAMMSGLGELRYEPIDKRIRGLIDGHIVLDSTRAMVVWEPKRITPSYAVRTEDVDGELLAARPGESGADAEGFHTPQLGNRPVYDPRVPFAVHTAAGEELDLHAAGVQRRGAAFRPEDEALEGYVILDFDAFDQWLEEDEPNIGHPHDPFHRIEILHSSRRVRIELDGRLLAETVAACFLLEPPLPPRYYVPAADVVQGALRPSDTRSTCAYKGRASYWSVDGADDIAWSYPAPLREAAEVAGRIAFFNERVEITVDGVAAERPVTPWSRG